MTRLAWPLLAAVVVAALMLPFGIHEQLLTAAITALQLIYLAQCWNIVAGYAGHFSLGHSVFLGIGAYTSTALFLTFGVSPWLGAIAGAALAAVAGVALGALAFRYRVKGVFFAVLTLGSMEVLRGIVPNLDFIGGANGLFIPAADAPRVLPGAPARVTSVPEPISLVVATRAVASGNGAEPVARLTFAAGPTLPVDSRVDIEIDGEEHVDAVLVPAEALVRTGTQTIVVVAVGNRAERRMVTIGLADADSVEILSGVEAGDFVITRGQAGLADGSAA